MHCTVFIFYLPSAGVPRGDFHHHSDMCKSVFAGMGVAKNIRIFKPDDGIGVESLSAFIRPFLKQNKKAPGMLTVIFLYPLEQITIV